MSFDITNILTYSGLILYSVNYAIGWLLHFRIIKLTRRAHQVIYILLITNLILLLLILLLFTPGFLWNKFLLYLLSLALILALPFGKKGGMYHRIISTFGFLAYISAVFIY